MTTLDLSPDELLTTTRTVRKRLDLEKPVPLELIRECIEIALQAPSGSNRQTWHWLVITDAEKRAAIGEFYRLAVEVPGRCRRGGETVCRRSRPGAGPAPGR